MSDIAWLDCSSGVSGDMVLGATVDAGVPVPDLQRAVDAVLPGVRLSAERVRRAGIAATQVRVQVPADDDRARPWRDVRTLLERATLPAEVRDRALEAFRRLAAAEAAVHGVAVDDVHFHEVGAHDAVADVVGACAGLAALGLTTLSAGPVALGGGTARSAHGDLPVPAPAVLALLAGTGATVHGGPGEAELATPTGAALLVTWVDGWGPLPPMQVDRVAAGAGGRDDPGRPNVLRLVVGAPAQAPGSADLLLEANVDDLDPRLWPAVVSALLSAGAADAWLTPVLMKKGRPAHTLHVLCTAAVADAVRTVVFRETSTIGLRETAVTKRALDRETCTVTVDGEPVRVKVARLDGTVVNAAPEYDDVAAAAVALSRPAKQVLAAATAAAARLYA